jgi:serine/threonine protein kinase
MLDGKTLNKRYVISHTIGDGGMGSVYQAFDVNLQTTVAIKHAKDISKQPVATRQMNEKAFEHEARLLASLRHPGLPKVTDYFNEEPHGSFLVMEYIPGEDLYARLIQREQPFELDTVLDWAQQLLHILEYLHTREPAIIHRDIKPNNLKLTDTNQIILLDFGLAKISGQESRQAYTESYAPIEQFRAAGTDSRSDLYSLSVTLYYLLSAQEPAGALTREAELNQHNSDPLDPLHTINPAVPESVSAVLHKGMEVEADNRYASAREMHDHLIQAIKQFTAAQSALAQTVALPRPDRNAATGTASADQSNQSQPTPRSGSIGARRPIVVGVVLVVAMIGIGLWLSGVLGQALATIGGPDSSGNTPPVAQLDPTPTLDPMPASEVPAFPEQTSVSSPTTPATDTTVPDATSTAEPGSVPPTGEIAYAAWDYDTGQISIKIASADGSAEPLSVMSQSLEISALSWSPDGTRLAFSAQNGSNSDIYVIERNGSGLTKLTDSSSNDEDPAWSPSGDHIAFVSDRNDNSDDIYIMNADGTNVQPLLTTDWRKSSPTWSPSGDQIAFVSRVRGNQDIFIIDVEGANDGTPRNLTDHPADDVDPAWSPDGRRIAFASDRESQTYNVYVMDVSTTSPAEPTALTEDPQLERSPTWSPTGNYIAFRASRSGDDGIYMVRLGDPPEIISFIHDTPIDEDFPVWAPQP